MKESVTLVPFVLEILMRFEEFATLCCECCVKCFMCCLKILVCCCKAWKSGEPVNKLGACHQVWIVNLIKLPKEALLVGTYVPKLHPGSDVGSV